MGCGLTKKKELFKIETNLEMIRSKGHEEGVIEQPTRKSI